jgi:hypothetical protein
MTEPTPIGDRLLSAAIAAVDDAGPTWPAMAEIPVLITSTQRPCMLLLPADISDQEVAELAAWMLLNARPWIARSGSPAGRIIVPKR